MSSPNNTVIVDPIMSSTSKTPSPQPQQSQTQSTSTSPKIIVGQGNHQLLFNKPPSPNKDKPSEEKDTTEDPSILKPTLSTSNLLADMENEGSTTVVTPIPIPAPSSSSSTTKKPRKPVGITVVKPPTATRRRPAPNTQTAAKKHSNPLVVTQMPGMKQVLSSLAGGLNLSDYIVKVDNKGTRWLKKFVEEPPKKLSEIPTDSRHNEVEITNWYPFQSNFGPTYILHTAKGVRYWATKGAIKTLDLAKACDLAPGNCTLMVKHINGLDFQFGLRFREDDSSSSSSVTVSTPPLKDDDDDDDDIYMNID